MRALGSRDDWSVADKRVVDSWGREINIKISLQQIAGNEKLTRVGNQIGLELVQVNVESTIEAQR